MIGLPANPADNQCLTDTNATTYVLLHGLAVSHLYLMPTARRLVPGSVYVPGSGRLRAAQQAVSMTLLVPGPTVFSRMNHIRHLLLTDSRPPRPRFSFRQPLIVRLLAIAEMTYLVDDGRCQG